jgi:Zn-dependent peptidase ImmA (M78 family)
MDLGDIKRFDSLEGKYPNFKTIVIKSNEGEDRVSGTNTRAALISGDKDRFLTYVPTELSDEDKENVWSILTKTPLDESVIGDKIKNFFNNFKDAYKGQKEDLKGFGPLVKKYLSKEPLTFEEKTKLNKNFKDILKMSSLAVTFPVIGVTGTSLLRFLINKISKGNVDILPSVFSKKVINELIIKYDLQEIYAEPSKFDYPKQLKSLTEFMLDKGMNIRPLPKVKFVEDDVENARNFFGKTAYYDPNQRVIVLYTMDRHPKDIMRSFAHEMIHHMQNCENRLGNIATQDTNEDGDLPKIEREAYEKGNMTFRNWTDTITEWIVDTSKYNYTPKLSNKIFSQLHELKVNEISLNPNNAVEIYGDLFSGEFKVGNIEYIYSIKNIPSPYKDEELFYNIQFDEKNNNESSNEPTRNARENYIKILSTMYKILLDFVEQEKPEYIGISSLDKSGYGNIYNNLTKTNKLPGYSRKDAGLDFISKSGEKGKFIVLKKSIIDRIDCDKCDHSWPIITGGNDLYICHKCGHDNTPKQLNEEEEEDNGTLLYKSIFKPDINILVAFKNYENYKILKPLFNKYGYGFYSPEDKIIILNGERFINSDLDFRDFKFVEAHEITHLLLGHTGPYSEEDEMDADLGAYILLKNKKLSTDRLVNEFENRHGVPFTEELLERVKNRL